VARPLRGSDTVKLGALLRKAIVRHRLERDAEVSAARLTHQAPGADRRALVQHLKRVQLALLRILHRDYGVCAACGRPIPDARLALMPTAGTCAACQKKLDAQAGAKRGRRWHAP
jgi:RNA polymerase-binding transcription factor DksA